MTKRSFLITRVILLLALVGVTHHALGQTTLPAGAAAVELTVAEKQPVKLMLQAATDGTPA